MKKLFTLLFVFLAALSASATDYEVEAANIAAFNANEPIGNGFNNMNGWYLVPISEDAIVAYVQPTEVTFDFSDPNFRENIGESLTDVKGNIYNETFTALGDL